MSASPDPERVERYREHMAARQQAHAELLAGEWTAPRPAGSLKKQLAAGVAEPTFSIDRLVPTGANVLLNAQYKKGKTTCALNVVRAVADGEPLFGEFDVRAPKRVAWWNGEISDAMALTWLDEMKIRHPQRVFPLHLRGLSMPLALPAVRDWSVDWLRKHRIKVWVVDPFGALYDGEENSNSEVRDWLRHLDEIKRRAGVDVLILVAHTGHDAQDDDAVIRARGGARLMDWPDVIWTYRAGNEHDPTRRYLGAYGRDVEVPEFTLDFEPSTRTLRRVVGATSRYADRKEALAEKAAGVVAEHHAITGEPMNKTSLENKLGRGKANLKREAIDEAVEMGWIRVEEGPNRSRLHYPGADRLRLRPGGRGDGS